MDKDIIIIGGGPGGYTAAIRASQLGAKVCIIEKDKIGGTCLNRGCIPTKILYRNAEILNTLKNVDEHGINVDSITINVDKVHEKKKSVVDQLIQGIYQIIKANNVEIILGTAAIKNKNMVMVISEKGIVKEISASNIIIATGAKSIIPNIPGMELSEIYTSDTIIDFKSIPKSLTIVGGGVIGMEFACIFNSLGSKTTIVEFMQSILPTMDSEITKRLTPSLKKKGLDINTCARVTRIEKSEEIFTLYCEGKKGEFKLTSEAVLLATGRTPMTEGLNLENLKCDFNKKGIKVDGNYETNIKGIYAIGDVNGKTMLAHAAAHQGIKAVEHIMGIEKRYDNEVVPSCVFTFPEVASVGITEDEAKEKGLDYKVSKFSFSANGKALTLRETEGMVKVISAKAKESNSAEVLVGVHIIGPHASDLIHEAALAVSSAIKVEDIINMIHAHPTLSEAFSEAVMGLKHKAIHMINAKSQSKKGL